ncbi:hypothetical protein ACVWXL_008849 [Bradyrhizobium sp. GM22.5]
MKYRIAYLALFMTAFSHSNAESGDSLTKQRLAQAVVHCQCIATNKTCTVRAAYMPGLPKNGLCDCDGDWGMFAPECPVSIVIPKDIYQRTMDKLRAKRWFS